MSFQKILSPLYSLIINYFNVSISGLENISPGKSYIFAANHQSILDVPLIFSILALHTDSKIHILISHRFYRALWFLTRPLEMISVRMDKNSESSLRHNRNSLDIGLQKLRQGHSILIFPEGIITGGKTSQIIRGQTGAVKLSLLSGVPIIPIGINGSNYVHPYLLSNNSPFRFNRHLPITIRFGKEVVYSQHSNIDLHSHTESNRKLLRSLTNKIMSRLSILSRLPMAHISVN